MEYKHDGIGLPCGAAGLGHGITKEVQSREQLIK